MKERTRTGLNGVNGGVRERAHGARDEPDDHVLVRRQVRELRLHLVRELLELLVRGEVGTYTNGYK